MSIPEQGVMPKPDVVPAVAPDTQLTHELIRLGATPASKAAAIEQACQMLIAAGCVAPGYAQSMARREAVANTYLGHGVAIPHGLGEDRGLVHKNGIAVLQIPGGLAWNPGQDAKLVVAIAARSDHHITILRRLTRLIQDDTKLEALFTTADAGAIIAALTQDTPALSAAAAADLAESLEWTVDYPAGLHARPASAWVEAARQSGLRLQIRLGRETADPRNLVALLQLGARPGDTLVISGEGPDAKAALARFRGVIAGLSAQEQADAARAATKAAAPVQGFDPPSPLQTIAGIGASAGLAHAPVHVLKPQAVSIPDEPGTLADGGQRLNDAIAATRQQLVALVDDTTRRLGAADAGIFRAQGELLGDTDLITLACQMMVEGHGVAWAWNQAVERLAQKLAALNNPVLAARAADLRDVGRRVLAKLHPGLEATTLGHLPDHKVILIAADLSPSDTASLDLSRIAGLAIAQGGPTSHTAILARTLGLPALVGGGDRLLEIAPGTPAILDGQSGRLYLDPTPEAARAAAAWSEDLTQKRAAEAAEREQPAVTQDGARIEIGANINSPDQVAMALGEGAEGVGLMRTEFLFLERGDTPSEDDQCATYRAMAANLGGRTLIIRTLDIGGDKQVAHLNLPHEDNPFLGVRGARLLLRRPDLLMPQLRAIYRAAKEGGRIWIMFPMITSVAEFLRLRESCEAVRADVDGPQLPIGIMIEVPAAAIMADSLAAHVDFFSIGTNDLTQYTLAIDRQNRDLAAEADSLHPAVLRLIGETVAGAKKHDRWVGVCGGIAGDPFGAALLAGLGVNELSMTPRDIPGVKARLRQADMGALRRLAHQALNTASAAEIRALDQSAP
jgi:phosphocarrier protein FPr